VNIERQARSRTLLSVEDWLGIDMALYDALEQLAEVQGDMETAGEAIHTICALRAFAFDRNSVSPIEVAVKTFQIAFSTRSL
jgi:hypothetical protein